MSLTYSSELIVFSKNIDPTLREAVTAQHTHNNLLIVKGHFKRLPRINTAPVPTVLSIDMPTQMESSFISEKC
jgi:hypothetical protein